MSIGAVLIFIFVIPKDSSTTLKILIPVDHSPDPQIAVDGAVSIAQTLECQELIFTLLHVGEEDRFPNVITPQRNIWQWKKTYGHGNVEQQILQAADECRSDLFVMATQGHHGFLDALRGSTTERIVRNSKCPVLAVPAYRNEEPSSQDSVVRRPAV
ncbi:MAG: universal stress protein [Acidobacteria bacterium]|nr:universal stress protein [Acidobacteriota bacterium]